MPTSQSIELKLLQILNNDDSKVPVADLGIGDSVVYSFEPMALPLFRFRAKSDKPLRIMVGSTEVTGDVDYVIADDGSTMTVTIRSGGPWQGKATFGLLNIVHKLLHLFDPTIKNRGL
jgi:hypothetical protein